MKTYNRELEEAIKLATIASEAILDIYYGEMHLELKGDGTPVTNADIRSNEIIVAGLQQAFPNDGIVSEELATIEGDRVWYVDPIDGTKGFAGRTDQFAVHIGLAEDEKPVLGVVYKPTTGEYYYGVKGQGAYRVSPNGLEKRLEVSNAPEDKTTLIVNKSFLLSENGKTIMDIVQPEKVHISGSEGLRIMKVVEGTADAHFLSNAHLCSTWDLCAPHAIAEEAGAYVSFIDGSPIKYQGQRKLGQHFVVTRTPEQGAYFSRLLKEYSG